MLLWKKKKDTDVKVQRSNELIVRMRGGSTYSWVAINWDGKSKALPWREFYRWFFGRTGEFFVMRYKTGETMLRRSDILIFTIQIK